MVRDATPSSGVCMQLGRMFTAFVLMFGLSLFFLGSWATPPTETNVPYDGEMRILDQPEQIAPPSSTVMATPKGRRVLKPVRIGHDDIPLTALLAYQRAAGILSAVEPSCGLSWTLLAAIGRVESDHGRYGGATLGADGVPRPQVVGVALDGGGPVAKIHDTDNGSLDGDRTWDRAVGPMQFLPTTWEMVGVDGDGDGVRSIDDIDDAALAAAIYLCAGPEHDLREPKSMDSALHRYNDSDSYVALVLAYEKRYRTGDFDVLASDGGVAEASAVLAARPLTGTPLEAHTPAQRRQQAQLKTQVRKAVASAEKTGGTTPGISARSSAPSTPAEGTGTDGTETKGTDQPGGTVTGAASEPGSTTSPDGNAGDGNAGDATSPDSTAADAPSTATEGGGAPASEPGPSGADTSGSSAPGNESPSGSSPSPADAATCTSPTADPPSGDAPGDSPSDVPSTAPCDEQGADPSAEPTPCEPTCSPSADSAP
jgi:hypothetical protein